MEFFISFFCPRLPSVQATADPANADNSIKCTAFRLGVVSCGEERGHLIQLGSGLIQRWEQRSLCCGVLPGAWCRISMRGFLDSCTGIYPVDLVQMCSQLRVTVFFVLCMFCFSPCLTLALGPVIRAVNSPVHQTSGATVLCSTSRDFFCEP